MKFSTIALFSTILLISCAKKSEEVKTAPAPVAQTTSFSGKPLYSKAPDSIALAKTDSTIAALKNNPELSEQEYIEIGKQNVAAARYKEAVAVYSEGLRKYPESYQLLRNRGHRYITLRKLDSAIVDLTKAEQLMPADKDVMEYGLDGKATATVRHQIYYHIGVYNYLIGDYEKAASAFEKAVATGGDVKNVIGASDWLYNSYQRLGKKAKAEEVIASIKADTETDRENAYFKRIMLYKGVIKPEELVDTTVQPSKMNVSDVTKLYGLANWYRYNGNTEKANELCKIILASDAWPGFAYAGAEKDVMN